MSGTPISNSQFWLAMGIIYGFVALTLLVIWWHTRRSIRRWRTPPVESADPAKAAAAEAAVLLGREKYDRGEFRRAVVRRIPTDLFGDDLVLECGHRSSAT